MSNSRQNRAKSNKQQNADPANISDLSNLGSESEPPDGVHPVMFSYLKEILDTTRSTNKEVETLSKKIDDIESKNNEKWQENDEVISELQSDNVYLKKTVQMLCGRLVRAEQKCERLANELESQKSYTMNNNIIVNVTKKYKEVSDENTRQTFINFCRDELKISNPEAMYIPVAHRLGAKNAKMYDPS